MNSLTKTRDSKRRRYRTLLNGQPTSAISMQTEKAELATGHLAANIRNTRANYARGRALVEQGLKPQGHRPGQALCLLPVLAAGRTETD
jgi:hypothetical protein